jgi:hypothetical protein
MLAAPFKRFKVEVLLSSRHSRFSSRSRAARSDDVLSLPVVAYQLSNQDFSIGLSLCFNESLGCCIWNRGCEPGSVRSSELLSIVQAHPSFVDHNTGELCTSCRSGVKDTNQRCRVR